MNIIYKIRKHLIESRLKSINGIDHLDIYGDVTIANINGLHLSDYVYIGPGAHFWGSGDTYIGYNTIIGPGFSCINTNHDYKGESVPYGKKNIPKPVTIGDNVWIGANVNIVPGVTVGNGAVISMGTTVTKDVPEGAIVGSNELKIIAWRDREDYLEKVNEGCLYLPCKFAERASR